MSKHAEQASSRKAGQAPSTVPDTPHPAPANTDCTPLPNDDAFSISSHSKDRFDPIPDSVFEAIKDTEETSEAAVNIFPKLLEFSNPLAVVNQTSDQPIKTQEIPNPPKAPPAVKAAKNGPSETSRYVCPICSKEFRLPSSYYYHKKHFHEGVKEHTCNVCGRNFAVKSALTAHLTLHTGDKPYSCPQCSKEFRSKASVYIHYKNVHCEAKTFTCTTCNRSFRWKQKLLRHIASHTKEKKYFCTTCNKGFAVKYDLTRHVKLHVDSKQHVCNKCGVTFSQLRCQESGSNVKRKRDTEHKQETKVIQVETQIKKDKKAIFPASNISKKSSDGLLNHCSLSARDLRAALNQSEKVVSCHLCSKSFLTGKQLKVHCARCAETVCARCKARFPGKGQLEEHVAGCATFACQHCPKRFISSDTLATHQGTKHATARCPYCLSSFSSDLDCHNHKLDYHNFDCGVCLKVFLYTIDQMKAKFANTKGKIVCDLCQRTYKDSDVEDEIPSAIISRNVKRIKLEEMDVFPIKLEAGQSEDPLADEDGLFSYEEGNDAMMQYQCCYCKGVYNSFNDLNNHLIDSHNLQFQELSTDSQPEKDACDNALEKFEYKIDELFDAALSLSEFENQSQYSCPVCNKVFKSSVTYKKHTYRSHKVHLLFGVDKQFHCQHCRADRSSLCELNKHLYSRHESNVKCDHCDQSFATKREKKIHILGQHPDQPAFSCLDCPSKFSTHNELKQHCSWHWFHEIIECKQCSKKIKGKKKFKIHSNYHRIRLNQGDKEIICPECGKGLSSRSSLQAHLRFVHRGGNEDTVLCGDCGLLVRVRRFNRHHERMHSQGNLFRCHICSRSFFAKELLRQHMDTHIDGRPHECDMCPAAFKQVRNLRMHKRNYHTENSTSCKMCNMEFETPVDYSVHRLTYHKRTPRPIKLEAEEGFQCPLCPKVLKSSRAVATHRRIAHEKHLHVKCQVCHAEFPFIRQLQSHMSSHTEPKPDLSCGFCHRTFTTLGSLNSHIKWVHVGERNFPCSYCPAKFKRKDAQIVHERTHTDERPYSCGVCQRRFRQRTDCKRHEAKHAVPGFRYNKPHRMRPRPPPPHPHPHQPEVLIEEVVEQLPGEDNQAAAYLSYIVQN